MKTLNIIFLLFSLLSLYCNTIAGANQYEGLRWVRLHIENQIQLQGVSQLHLDVWSSGSNLIFGYNDVLMKDDDIQECWNLGISLELLSYDIDIGITREGQEQSIEPEFGADGFGDDWFASYHNYDDIVSFLEIYAGDYPDIVTYNTIGTSYEGKNIPVVTVTGVDPTPNKLKIIVIGGLQGREWISPATVLYIFKTLIESYETDSSLLDRVSISFIPLSNPDGYEYSWTSKRLWKKNRRANSDKSFGVDLNRNFDEHWGVGCSSGDTYCGEFPFSELETQAIRDFVLQNGPFTGAVDFTGYAQGVVRPFSWSQSGPSRDQLFKSIAEKWATKMQETSGGAIYKSQNAFEVFNVTGNVRDWMFSSANVAMSFTVQLRGEGTTGFLLPPAQILPTGIENYGGFILFIQSLFSHA